MARLEKQSQTDVESVDESIIAALMTAPRAEHVEQLRRQAELRGRFMAEVPLLTSADVARISGSSARNVSAKANRWKSERRVFSVNLGGVDHYPAFQFTVDGEPVAAMRELLDVFSGLSDWQIALWFFMPDAWLHERAPMDIVQRDPQSVIAAARHFIEPVEG